MPGTMALVEKYPKCSFCNSIGLYDFKTFTGQWAYGCIDHWRIYRMYEDLGVGKGQMLQLKKPVQR